MRAVLLSLDSVSPDRLRSLRAQQYSHVVLALDEKARSVGAAVQLIGAAGLRVDYWIEIGRNPAIANKHPEWMASLQGHPEWRRLFPNAPKPADGEVVKNYPWVPILYKETFDAHLQRVARLLKDLPAAQGIFLNDLQSAPSACGCGNDLCRWTADYGPIKTATPLGNDAAGRFVEEVRKLAKGAEIIPVWASECEEHEKPTRCAGVGCFEGTCWYQFTEQLMPVAAKCDRLGLLLPYKAFQKDEPRYGPKAGWVKDALSMMSTMPPKRKGKSIPADRLIAVLQGWDVTPEEVKAQIERSSEAGAAGYVVSMVKIEQSWEPRNVKTRRE